MRVLVTAGEPACCCGGLLPVRGRPVRMIEVWWCRASDFVRTIESVLKESPTHG